MARLQRGLITRRQLLAIGIGDDSIHRSLRAGRLHRWGRGVYAAGHLSDGPLLAETRAVLLCGEGAVLSHQSAARLWKLLPPESSDGLMHVTVPGQHGVRCRGLCLHRSTTLAPGDVRAQHGLPLTAVTRTLLDLAEVVDTSQLHDALDEALVQRLVSRPMLAATAAAARGRHGAQRLRAALGRHTVSHNLRSEAERRLLELIRAAELPEPRMNVYVHGCLVDAYWPEHGLVVEVDSVRYHSSVPVFERDRDKGNRLVAAGLAVMRLTWHQLRDQPLLVVARIAQAIGRAEACRA